VLSFVLGLGAGVAISAIAKVLETSRLAFGPFAFYGNGALIVLSLGAGLAIFGLWTWVLRSGRGRRELLWSAIGLYLGVGTVALPSLPGMLFTGIIFVLPTAAVTYALHRALGRRGERLNAALQTGIVGLGMGLALLMPVVAVGLIVGPFLAAAVRATQRGIATLSALLALVMLVGALGVPLLFMR